MTEPVDGRELPTAPDRTVDLSELIRESFAPAMRIGLQDAELFDAPGAERIEEWITCITEWVTDKVSPLLERQQAEIQRLRVAADPAKVDAVGDLVKHATRLVQTEREDARAEVARLRAGEADGPGDTGAWPTPGEWIRRWNDATATQRLAMAEAHITLERAAWARARAALR